ncbi:MAG TPA: zinc ribbon domain-containing protein [Kiritimatiellia bacterium]|nr:zinc ribbon domain-containing protein [Kiritimatiellia bacterium]HMO98410.1 zinc ribbon domain-containing protein [Kiritimatiellia bacterium]HMP96463.1 zinc ribbon domain-containing protein [Kiritimatiellia bacterium]
MPVYVYETTDDGPRRVIELYQSIKEDALSRDPETGRPVRRVISGGLEMPRAKSDPPKIPRVHHSDSCACCNPRPR